MATRRKVAVDFNAVIVDKAKHTLESTVEKFFREEAVEYGCMEHKVMGVLSWPDRNLYWPVGVCDMVELKRPKGGRYEKGQKELHEVLRQHGFECVTLRTKAEVAAWFRKRSVTLGVARRPPLPALLRGGTLNAVEYAAALKKART